MIRSALQRFLVGSSSLSLAFLAGVALLGGCTSGGSGGSGWGPGVKRITDGQAIAAYDPSIDRIIHFGPRGGPNMLHTANLGLASTNGEQYIFRGGCYTWVAPQKGEHGWIAADGTPRDWPPDPAMDRGPTRVLVKTSSSLLALGNTNRRGLSEMLIFDIRENGRAILMLTLNNQSDETRMASGWINTAVDPAGRIAVRAPAGTPMRGWDDRSVEALRSIMSEPDSRGWAVLDLTRARWDGGIKVWIDGPCEIAVWKDGWWLHRTQFHNDRAGLASVGEAPVAVYIEPGAGLIEAELLGSLATIPAGESHATREVWRLIESPEPTSAALPE